MSGFDEEIAAALARTDELNASVLQGLDPGGTVAASYGYPPVVRVAVGEERDREYEPGPVVVRLGDTPDAFPGTEWYPVSLRRGEDGVLYLRPRDATDVRDYLAARDQVELED